MKHRITALLLCLLLLAGCTPGSNEPNQVNIVATTYPAYLAALTATDGVDGVSVTRLDTGSVSCLHDYTLTVNDMKKLSRADIIVMNGAGMEDFMTDALAASDATVIDCSEGLTLLPAAGHHDHAHDDEGHDHDNHFDGHYWMDPLRMATAVDTVQTRLLPLFGDDHAAQMTYNAETARLLLEQCHLDGRESLSVPDLHDAALITFHDGFGYFAAAFDLPLLASIEEEAGSEASAKEIVHISKLVREHSLPAIFTEVNGSDATAQAIRRETGCRVYALSTLMDGREPFADEVSPIMPYIEAMNINIATVLGAFAESEVE